MSPTRQLELLRRELQQYDPSLLAIPAVVAANKSDTLSSSAVDAELDRLRPAAICLPDPFLAVQDEDS